MTATTSSIKRCANRSPEGAAATSPTVPRIMQVMPPSEASISHLFHSSVSIRVERVAANFAPCIAASSACTRGVMLPSSSPYNRSCIGLICTIRKAGSRSPAMRQTPPSTRPAPNRACNASKWRMPFSTGTIAVSGPTAGAMSVMAGSSA